MKTLTVSMLSVAVLSLCPFSNAGSILDKIEAEKAAAENQRLAAVRANANWANTFPSESTPAANANLDELVKRATERKRLQLAAEQKAAEKKAAEQEKAEEGPANVAAPQALRLKLNAYGPGVNADQFGRAHSYRLQNGDKLPVDLQAGVRRDAYGFGVHADKFGRPVYDSTPK